MRNKSLADAAASRTAPTDDQQSQPNTENNKDLLPKEEGNGVLFYKFSYVVSTLVAVTNFVVLC
jgi:hypothetical protein